MFFFFILDFFFTLAIGAYEAHDILKNRAFHNPVDKDDRTPRTITSALQNTLGENLEISIGAVKRVRLPCCLFTNKMTRIGKRFPFPLTKQPLYKLVLRARDKRARIYHLSEPTRSR